MQARALARKTEAAGARLDRLVAAGQLAGYASPARILPSPAVQQARREALPDAAPGTVPGTEAVRAERSPWDPDPDGARRRQAGLDRF